MFELLIFFLKLSDSEGALFNGLLIDVGVDLFEIESFHLFFQLLVFFKKSAYEFLVNAIQVLPRFLAKFMLWLLLKTILSEMLLIDE